MSVLKDDTKTQDTFQTLPDYIQNSLREIALNESMKNYKIHVSVIANNGENYLSTIGFVDIVSDEINDDDVATELNLIMKIPFTLLMAKNSQQLNNYFKREKFIYTEFLPELEKLENKYDIAEVDKFKFAKCYEALSEEKEELLVLENLNKKHFTMCDRFKPVGYDHTMLIMKNIARFHALTFALKHQKRDFNNYAHGHAFKKQNFTETLPIVLEQCIDKVIECISDENNKYILRNYRVNILEKFYGLLDFNNNEDVPYNVFCHGDLWINNMLFKYEENVPTEMVMVDWQMFKYASPVTDLSYFIFNCTDEDFRNKHLDEAFDVYYSTLKKHLTLLNCEPEFCYPEKIFRGQIKDKLAFGAIIAFILVPLVLMAKKDVDVENWSKSEENVGFANAKFNANTVKRLNGIVRDMIRLQLI